MLDYYALLGVSRDATIEEINREYRDKLQFYHPDKWQTNQSMRKKAEEKSKAINEAYQILKDPLARSRYDAELLHFEYKKRAKAEAYDRQAEKEEKQKEQAEINRRTAETKRQQAEQHRAEERQAVNIKRFRNIFILIGWIVVLGFAVLTSLRNSVEEKQIAIAAQKTTNAVSIRQAKIRYAETRIKKPKSMLTLTRIGDINCDDVRKEMGYDECRYKDYWGIYNLTNLTEDIQFEGSIDCADTESGKDVTCDNDDCQSIITVKPKETRKVYCVDQIYNTGAIPSLSGYFKAFWIENSISKPERIGIMEVVWR